MWKKIIVVLILLVIIVLGLIGYSYLGNLKPPEGEIVIPIKVDTTLE